MKKLFLTTVLLLLAIFTVSAKSYKWNGLDHEYDVISLKQSGQSTQVLKVFAIAGNPDKAIDQALQDAVAAAIFTGFIKKLDPVPQPGLYEKAANSGQEFYDANKAYFDNFFKKGDFMSFVRNVNKNYPSGENNMAVDGGRRVGVNIEIDLDALRQKLEADGVLKELLK